MMLDAVDSAAEGITRESQLQLPLDRKPLPLVADTIHDEFKIWLLGDRITQTAQDIRLWIAVDSDVVDVIESDAGLSKAIADCF
jgi:hypothetical protein